MSDADQTPAASTGLETALEPTEVQIEWTQARAANQVLWDERAVLHEDAYDAHAFAADPTASGVLLDLPVLERFLPGHSVTGLRLAHLQCHIGTDTISLARAGARVTGLDLSAASLEVAGRLAAEAGVDAEWVQSDVLDARAALTGDFDVVFTSIGTIVWVQDLTRWAAQIAELLSPGGVFYIRDGHPMMYALDESANPLFVAHRYFANGHAQSWDDTATYAGDGHTEHGLSYEYPHALSEIIGSLLGAGLELVHFDEGRLLPWQWSSIMEETADGWQFPEGLREKVPTTYTIVARRPELTGTPGA